MGLGLQKGKIQNEPNSVGQGGISMGSAFPNSGEHRNIFKTTT